jgi:hypothetical protein
MSSSPSTNFPASYDGVTKIISGLLCVVLLAAVISLRNVLAGAVLIPVIVLGYAYSPRGYSVSEKAITVKRFVGNIRIPLEDIREARPTSSDDLRGCMRLWASGGLFGYYGLFRTSKLGRCTWYAAHRKNTVVLIGASKTTVYSPDDVDGFLNAIRAEVPFAAGDHSEAAIAGENETASNPATMWIVLLLVSLAALGALAAILGMLRAHRGI